MRNRDDIATRQKLPHPGKGHNVFIDHLLKQRGRQPQHTDPLLLDHASQSRQIDRAVRIDRKRGAVEQRAPDLKSRRIKGQWCQLQDDIVRRQCDIVRLAHQPHDIAVIDDDAFWGTGRP